MVGYTFFHSSTGKWLGYISGSATKPSWRHHIKKKGFFSSEYIIDLLPGGDPVIDPGYDSLSVSATRQDVNVCLNGGSPDSGGFQGIRNMPIESASGHVFDFDINSRAVMEGAINRYDYFDNLGLTDHHKWLLNDNSLINITKQSLENYYQELWLLSDLRYAKAWPEAQKFKSDIDNGLTVTLRDLENWKQFYEVT